jgi:hypothetical protein
MARANNHKRQFTLETLEKRNLQSVLSTHADEALFAAAQKVRELAPVSTPVDSLLHNYQRIIGFFGK